jgi:hypothetical protein
MRHVFFIRTEDADDEDNDDEEIENLEERSGLQRYYAGEGWFKLFFFVAGTHILHFLQVVYCNACLSLQPEK